MSARYVIVPERAGYCHSPQAKRTKCACGRTVTLSNVTGTGRHSVACECGRVHVKEVGSAFRCEGGFAPKRPGGKAGCPGTYRTTTPTTEPTA